MSIVLDAVGLVDDEYEGDEPGKATSRDRYEAAGENMVGAG